MKKILALIVILLVSIALVACDKVPEVENGNGPGNGSENGNGTKPGNGNGNQYEVIDQKIGNIIAQIVLPERTIEDLNLITTWEEHPTAVITWHSSNTAAILTNGQVFRSSVDQTVTLTVTVQLETRSQFKQFEVIVERYIQTTPLQAVVTFVVDDYVTIDELEQVVEIGEGVVRPNVSKTGYILIGWFTDALLTNEWIFDTDTVKEDMNLYPRWQSASSGQPIDDDLFVYDGFMMGVGEYYESIANLIGDELKMELRDIITTTHHGVTYGDARAVLARSDRDYQTNYSTARGIYNDVALMPFWWTNNNAAGYWQREHVWPQSKLGAEASNTRANIASDLHNLRAIDSVNQTRGNRYFTNPTNPDADTSIYSLVGTTAFFPGDDHKGDVARILLYMIVRWPQLSLSSDAAEVSNSSNLTMGLLDVLLRWHREDPPCRFEIERNEFIYSHEGPQNSFYQVNEFRNISNITDFSTIRPQGNRNPFIDKPALVHLIWEGYTIVDLLPEELIEEANNLVMVEYLSMPVRIWYEI